MPSFEDNQVFVPFFEAPNEEQNLKFKSLIEKYLEGCKMNDVVPQTSVLVENDK